MAVKHAVLSASSSERWLNCPPSARLCEAYEDKGSDYAAEGTDAHALCEFRLKQVLGIPTDNPIENLSWYNEEMEDCAAGYAAYVVELLETAKQTCTDPVVMIEQRVNFSRWVQDGFGTADCIVIADGVMNICDYKHGKGVEVSAVTNPQMMLYALGLKTIDGIIDDMTAAAEGNEDELEKASWSYEDILGIDFRVIPSCDKYQKSGEGYIDATETETGLKYLFDSDNAIKLKVVGIIRKSSNAVGAFMNGSIGYTSALTEHVIDRAAESELIKAQKDNPEVDVISGLKFKVEGEEITEEEIAQTVDSWLVSLTESEKAAVYTEIMSVPEESYLQTMAMQYRQTLTPEAADKMIIDAAVAQTQMDEAAVADYVANMDPAEKEELIMQIAAAGAAQQYAEQVSAQLGAYSTEQLAAMLASTELTPAQYRVVFDNHIPATRSERTYEEVLKLLGDVDKASPSAIYIYAASFEDKDNISDLIESYNSGMEEEDKISYTDYVKLLMSSVTTIISAISYVLMAFVAISLVVSSIMIGIITYISVLERTKEIGILRAVGASKKDISRVFNAETMIVGFVAGAIGIGITLLLLIPINIVLHILTGIEILSASLPVAGAVILVAISIGLTLIAGLIPSGIAAKKDPVVALRTE